MNCWNSPTVPRPQASAIFDVTESAARTIWSPRTNLPGPRKVRVKDTTSSETRVATWCTKSRPALACRAMAKGNGVCA